MPLPALVSGQSLCHDVPTELTETFTWTSQALEPCSPLNLSFVRAVIHHIHEQRQGGKQGECCETDCTGAIFPVVWFIEPRS